MLPAEREELENFLGWHFSDPAWLELAVTHSSRQSGAERGAAGSEESNERLEMLGDAVLGLVITDQLTTQFPDWSLGRLNRAKAYLVSARTLAAMARRFELGRFLQLGPGEDRTGGREKTNLLADAYEAVVAAVYRDAGLEQARALVLRTLWEPALKEGAGSMGRPDAKTALQDQLRSRHLNAATYRLVSTSGPEHRRTFRVEVLVGGRPLAEAEGHTKKQAELEAARFALAQLDRLSPDGDGS
jgi:ribonuclease-3